MINEITSRDEVLSKQDADLLNRIDFLRLDAGRRREKDRQARLGQFFTPAPIARLMASMLTFHSSTVHILDAGAGVGSLFAACVAELCNRDKHPQKIYVTAYEIDESLIPYIHDTFRLCQSVCERAGVTFAGVVRQRDFIADSVEVLQETLFSSEREKPAYTCAILNPPYRKIQTRSVERKLLQTLGIESSNLYAGFLAIATQLLTERGELVAITPRSFCNGPYFKHFRQRFLQTMSLRRLHVFDARDKAFQDDAVLQENIILHAVKSTAPAERVTISSSTGSMDDSVLVHDVCYDQVVHPKDPQVFIRVVQDSFGQQVTEYMARFQTSLEELGLNVSTGRVVDFRAQDALRSELESNTIPLLFPTHVRYGSIIWPGSEGKKPNALVDSQETKVLQVPNEYYVLVKRFSAKEEKKRIVAAVYDPRTMPGSSVGFENHLNYFHCNGRGLSPQLAKGLAAYLNSTLVDSYFRQFNGHTQVNATDLRHIKYPSLQQLLTLSDKIPPEFPEQLELDELLKKEFFSMEDAGTNGASGKKSKQKIEEALSIIKALGFPRQQQNERSALTLLALLNLKPEKSWSQAEAPLFGITPMMDFFREHYDKNYAPNSRETVRRQTVHQFLEAGLIVANPDDPKRPINSGKTVYQIEQGALELLRTFGTADWEMNLKTYLSSIETLTKRYARERAMHRIPVTLAPGKTITLSPGGQNILVEKIIHEFAEIYTPGGKVLYVGDTDDKFAYYDKEGLAELGVIIESHGKMPDVIIHHTEKNWLILIEAVTSHGPIDGKRKDELRRLFRASRAGLVYVTTFLTRGAMMEYLKDISWETEVWVAEMPTHLIHFNGERFLGPYEDNVL